MKLKTFILRVLDYLYKLLLLTIILIVVIIVYKTTLRLNWVSKHFKWGRHSLNELNAPLFIYMQDSLLNT